MLGDFFCASLAMGEQIVLLLKSTLQSQVKIVGRASLPPKRWRRSCFWASRPCGLRMVISI